MENFVLIGDKGFHSDENVKELQKKEINYVLALKRDSDYINYNRIKDNDRKKFDGYFMYNKKHIWFCIQKINDGEKIITYLDETLKAEEESDILRRITYLENISKEKKLSDKEKKQLSDNKERLYDKSHRNGTLSVRTNLDKSAEEVYQIMKSRINVEQAFDTFKNTLEADRSYMRDEKQLEGWLFINFIAMQLYYKIYAMLLDKKMLNNYSPVDVLIHLKRVYMLRMADKWQLSEMPKQSRDIIKKMNIDIPIT
jgi:transposase